LKFFYNRFKSKTKLIVQKLFTVNKLFKKKLQKNYLIFNSLNIILYYTIYCILYYTILYYTIVISAMVINTITDSDDITNRHMESNRIYYVAILSE